MNLQILCFNIHKGIGWGKWKYTIQQIKNQIAEVNFDIIFFQEIRIKQIEFIASELMVNFSFGKNVHSRKGNYGNAIISKYPIIFSNNLNLTVRPQEKRGLLHSVTEIPHHKKLHLLCSHLGLVEKDRRKQLDMIVNYINTHIPKEDLIIFGGDFNDWKGYATLPLIKNLEFEEAFLNVRKSYAKSFPAWIPLLKLDRVYFKGFHAEDVHRLVNKSWRYLSDHIALTVSLSIES